MIQLAGLHIWLTAFLFVLGCSLLLAWYARVRKSIRLLGGWSVWEGTSPRRFGVRIVCLFCVLLLSSLVLLGPSWGTETQKLPHRARVIIVALDVSRSMLAKDVAPNRLEHAKQLIKKTLKNVAGDEQALILFSGDAYCFCPLTRDSELFTSFLDDVSVESISRGATNITSAVNLATTLVKKRKYRESLLLVVTDGEDFSSGVQDAMDAAHTAGMYIVTVGVGTEEGAPIPNITPEGGEKGFIKNKEGTVVISKLNKEFLQELAAHKNTGVYVDGTAAGAAEMVEKAIKKFEPTNQGDYSLEHKQYCYQYVAVTSLLCLLIEWLL